MSEFIRLGRPRREPIDHPDDVTMMRRILNDGAFDASDADIQWAWRQYSDDTASAGWLDPEGMPDFVVFGAIVERLDNEESSR